LLHEGRENSSFKGLRCCTFIMNDLSISVGSGKWEVKVESGKWEVGSVKWEVGSGKWEVGSGKLNAI
jgi:hypothetical protein